MNTTGLDSNTLRQPQPTRDLDPIIIKPAQLVEVSGRDEKVTVSPVTHSSSSKTDSAEVSSMPAREMICHHVTTKVLKNYCGDAEPNWAWFLAQNRCGCTSDHGAIPFACDRGIPFYTATDVAHHLATRTRKQVTPEEVIDVAMDLSSLTDDFYILKTKSGVPLITLGCDSTIDCPDCISMRSSLAESIPERDDVALALDKYGLEHVFSSLRDLYASILVNEIGFRKHSLPSVASVGDAWVAGEITMPVNIEHTRHALQQMRESRAMVKAVMDDLRGRTSVLPDYVVPYGGTLSLESTGDRELDELRAGLGAKCYG